MTVLRLNKNFISDVFRQERFQIVFYAKNIVMDEKTTAGELAEAHLKPFAFYPLDYW